MKTLRVNFVDFWPNFRNNDNYFYHLLSRYFNVEIEEHNPQFIFFSAFGNEHRRYSCKRILFLGENKQLSDFEYDISFSFDPTTSRNFYLPLWVIYLNWFNVPYNSERDIAYLLDIDRMTNRNVASVAKKNRFCTFIVGNPNCSLRNDFCLFVNKYKKVDCPGRVLNNCEPVAGRGDQKGKIEFLSAYKFNICFENSKSVGYVTEKIIHPFYTYTIPIYWGGDMVKRYFNPKAFINVEDYSNFDEVLKKIIEIDQNNEIYEDMLRQPVYRDDSWLRDFAFENVIEKIIELL